MATRRRSREHVEAALHRLVGTATRCRARAGGERHEAPSRSVWSARSVNLTVDGLLGWEVDAGVPPSAPRRRRPMNRRRRAAVARARRTPHRPSIAAARRSRPGDPGYEDLAASHIVARLDRLSPAELAEIRAFEVANRGRRTVVGKIDQLLAPDRAGRLIDPTSAAPSRPTPRSSATRALGRAGSSTSVAAPAGSTPTPDRCRWADAIDERAVFVGTIPMATGTTARPTWSSPSSWPTCVADPMPVVRIDQVFVAGRRPRARVR